jgi:GNAT superfamily N-acetyltransferase
MEIVTFGKNDPVPVEFARLPFEVYRDDPYWIPVSPEKALAPFTASSSFHGSGEYLGFLALDKGAPAGRLAAFVNRRLTQEGEPVGTIGLFEVVEDFDTSERLLAAAFEWLRTRGIRRVWGPMNFTIFHGYRFMTQGFERVPFYGEPYNRPTYPEHFRRAGFRSMARWYSWDLTQEQVRRLCDYLHRRVSADELARPEVEILAFDPASFDNEFAQLHRIMTRTFWEHLGYTDISVEEFREVYSELGSILRRDHLVFARTGRGEIIGFCLAYPDVSQHVRKMRDRGERNAGPRPAIGCSRVCLHSFGIVKQERGTGVVHHLLGVVLRKCLEYKGTIAALVRERQRNVFERISPPTREYSLYERIL